MFKLRYVLERRFLLKNRKGNENENENKNEKDRQEISYLPNCPGFIRLNKIMGNHNVCMIVVMTAGAINEAPDDETIDDADDNP